MRERQTRKPTVRDTVGVAFSLMRQERMSARVETGRIRILEQGLDYLRRPRRSIRAL